MACSSIKDRQLLLEVDGGDMNDHEMKLTKVERKMDAEASRAIITDKLRILEELQTWESSFGDNSKSDTNKSGSAPTTPKSVSQDSKNVPKYVFKPYQPYQNSGNWRNQNVQNGQNNNGRTFWPRNVRVVENNNDSQWYDHGTQSSQWDNSWGNWNDTSVMQVATTPNQSQHQSQSLEPPKKMSTKVMGVEEKEFGLAMLVPHKPLLVQCLLQLPVHPNPLKTPSTTEICRVMAKVAMPKGEVRGQRGGQPKGGTRQFPIFKQQKF